ncbi:MAG: response regulator transcription factor [Bdellovibrionales bacterium]|nr:response regulator transcription factor [Bdellovibrionales bacterium]
MRILLVEDEKKLANFVKKALTESAYAVDVAASLEEAQTHAADGVYDLMILDVMLPDGSGFDLARWMREMEFTGPILMLTALNSTQDKVKGLDSGADDYLPKPFALEELKARVRALLRRHGGATTTSNLKFSNLEMNLVSREVSRGGEVLKLTSKEFALLEYLLRHGGRPVSRMEILEHVWDMSFDPGSNVVDVYVNMLRKKVDAPFDKKLIHTVVGFGYELKERA